MANTVSKKRTRAMEKMLELGLLRVFFDFPEENGSLGLSMYLLPSAKELEKIMPRLKKERNLEIDIESIDHFKRPKPTLSFSMRFSSEGNKTFSAQHIITNAIVEEILKVLGRVRSEVSVKMCGQFSFDSRTHRFSGGLTLPTRIPLKDELTERVGESDIIGMKMRFSDSPLQIGEVDLSIRNSKVRAWILAFSRFRLLKTLLGKVYEHALELVNLFIEEI